jgi:hypothetical protein
MVFHATFNNISVIPWRSVLLVEKTEVPQWPQYTYGFYFLFLVLNATFSNISAITWRPVLVVEEARVPGENHRPRASNW